jgi:WD40 repeat protein
MVALHPDGTGVAFVAADQSLRWFDRSTGAERTVLPGPEAGAGEVFDLSYSPTGDILLVVRAARAAAYRWPAGGLLWSREAPFSPCAAGWHPAGQRVAIGLDGRNDVLLCDSRTGQPEEFFSGHALHPRTLRFDQDGDRLFSIAWDGTLIAWNTNTGAVDRIITAFPSTLQFSADGRHLAFGRSETEIALATLEPPRFFAEFSGTDYSQQITCDVAVSPDGSWIASVDQAGIQFWDVPTHRLVWREEQPHVAWSSVAFTPDGSSLIYAAVGVGFVRRALPSPAMAMAFRPGAPELLAPGESGLLHLIDRTTGDWWVEDAATQHLYRWPQGAAADRIPVLPTRISARTRLSPDLGLVAITNDVENGVTVFHAETGAVVATLPTHRRAAIEFSPDGRWLLTGTKERYALWDVHTWQPGPSWPAMVQHHASANFRYSPDGKLVALRHGRDALEVRETTNYAPLLRLEPPSALRVEHIEWSPDGSSLFVLCTGHRLARWDLAAIRHELARRGLDW